MVSNLRECTLFSLNRLDFFTHRLQIRDIQDFLEPEPDTIENPTRHYAANAPKCLDIAINTYRALTLADVFETLPPRPQVDRILYVYFSAKDTRNRE